MSPFTNQLLTTGINMYFLRGQVEFWCPVSGHFGLVCVTSHGQQPVFPAEPVDSAATAAAAHSTPSAAFIQIIIYGRFIANKCLSTFPSDAKQPHCWTQTHHLELFPGSRPVLTLSHTIRYNTEHLTEHRGSFLDYQKSWWGTFLWALLVCHLVGEVIPCYLGYDSKIYQMSIWTFCLVKPIICMDDKSKYFSIKEEVLCLMKALINSASSCGFNEALERKNKMCFKHWRGLKLGTAIKWIYNANQSRCGL